MASRSTQPALVALFEKNKLEVVELICTAERYHGWWRGDSAMQTYVIYPDPSANECALAR
jgi:hypothetical protein